MRLAGFRAKFRMPGTAFFSEVSNQVVHQTKIGAVAQKAPFLRHRQQLRLRQCLQMERKIGRWHAQFSADFTGNQTSGTGLDQQPVDVEPNAGRQGFENFNGRGSVHVLIIQLLLNSQTIISYFQHHTVFRTATLF